VERGCGEGRGARKAWEARQSGETGKSSIQDGGTSSGGCVHEAFRKKKFYALKVKKGLSALCHISQAGINTL